MKLINTTKYFNLEDFNQWQTKAIEDEEAIYRKHKSNLSEINKHLFACQALISESETAMNAYYNLTLNDLWKTSPLKLWANEKTGKLCTA